MTNQQNDVHPVKTQIWSDLASAQFDQSWTLRCPHDETLGS